MREEKQPYEPQIAKDQTSDRSPPTGTQRCSHQSVKEPRMPRNDANWQCNEDACHHERHINIWQLMAARHKQEERRP